jgi:dTDP-4-dehydrorhamnose 3,5-epimerase
MRVIETGFQGLFILQPKVYDDIRGYFFESYKHEDMVKAGIDFTPVQDNESRSVRGVIRGLHYQLNPCAQAKLIRVVIGEIYDVAVDIRRSSKTFKQWYGVNLNSENKTQFFIPKGFAHGFSVLSDIAVIQYKCDNLYNPELERGISLNDPELGIDWKIGDVEPVISERDLKNPTFSKADINF